MSAKKITSKKTPLSSSAKRSAQQNRRVSFEALGGAVPERSERYAIPTPMSKMVRPPSPQLVDGEYTHMRTTESPAGELTSVGIFRIKGERGGGAPVEGQEGSFASPMQPQGRENMHIRFGSDGKEKPKSTAPRSGGCWVASSPAAELENGQPGSATKLTLWHKCDEPCDAASADWTVRRTVL